MSIIYDETVAEIKRNVLQKMVLKRNLSLLLTITFVIQIADLFIFKPTICYKDHLLDLASTECSRVILYIFCGVLVIQTVLIFVYNIRICLNKRRYYKLQLKLAACI